MTDLGSSWFWRSVLFGGILLCSGVLANTSSANAADQDRAQSVSEVVVALEAFAAVNGSFLVDGTGYGGNGQGWFHYQGGNYTTSIYSGLTDFLLTVPRDPLYTVLGSYSSNDFLIYRCKDRVGVFAKAESLGPSEEDQQWWSQNGCPMAPISNLNHGYYQVSQKVGDVFDTSVFDSQRISAVSEVVTALEAYGAEYGSYSVADTGYIGKGQGWFHYHGGSYPASIYSGLSDYLTSVPKDPLYSVLGSYSKNDFLIYRCKGKVGVFAQADSAEPSDEDQIWWTQNSCPTAPITSLNHGYYQVSQAIEDVYDTSVYDTQRISAVTEVVSALEAYGAQNGNYTVAGTGYIGQGQGWFHYQGGSYSASIYSGLTDYLGSVPKDPLYSVIGSYSRNDFLIYRCKDRVGVFAQADSAEPSDEDQIWWAQNSCPAAPITSLNHGYYQVSQSIAAVFDTSVYDSQRISAVTDVVTALEAYGSETGSYTVAGTGYAGQGQGWFHYQGGSYPASIYSGLSDYLASVPKDPLYSVWGVIARTTS